MAKTVTIDTGTSHKRIPKYSSIRIVENKT
jgi:hypothetical protein